jgi:hypothetical protein
VLEQKEYLNLSVKSLIKVIGKHVLLFPRPCSLGRTFDFSLVPNRT